MRLSNVENTLGIKRWKVNIECWEQEVKEIALQERYTTIASPETPEKAVSAEHSHNGDEVRLLLKGQAQFFVRIGDTEDVERILVNAGEMISIPAGVWHSFGPMDSSSTYESVRFFHDKESWTKINREK